MMHIIPYHLFESVSTVRHEYVKIPLDSVKYAFHWLTEGNLFTQTYGQNVSDSQKYILRKSGGKSIQMPPLPPTDYMLGGADNDEQSTGVCMTLDPTYGRAGVSGESKICIAMDFQALRRDFEVQDLTDNGEAEVRIKMVKNWPKYTKSIFVDRKSWERGDGWEGFFYRPVKEWMPEELKPIVHVEISTRSICKALKELQNKK